MSLPTDPLDRLLAQVDYDLNLFFKPLRDEIDRELAKPKPNISALERRIAARLAVLCGTTKEEFPASPLGRYTQATLSAARDLHGYGSEVSLTEDRQGDTTARRIFIGASNLRAMLVANLRRFAGAKAGKVNKEAVRQWFSEFVTVAGASNAIGKGGDHGLYQIRRTMVTEVAREAGVGLRVAAIVQRRNVAWTLSPSHTGRDTCDRNATANLHGLGPGVYPPAAVPPHPEHPFCNCRLEMR